MNQDEDTRPDWRKKIDPHNRWLKTFMGQGQQHTYWLYKVIDDVFYQEKQIESVVELGTGNGTLSIILALHAQLKGTRLFTIDHKCLWGRIRNLFGILDIRYQEIDIYTPDTTNKVTIWIDDEPCFLFCDGGSKIKEFRTFAPIIAPGSVIAAHDWTREIKMKDIEQTVKEQKLVPLFQDEWNREPDYIRTCFWKKT